MATNNFALITKYSQKALDQILIEKSATAILEGEQKFVKFDFTNAKKVKIGTLRTSGMGNYARAGSAGIQGNGSGFDGTGHNDGYPIGGGELVWNEYELKFDRAIQLRVDAMDDEEAAGLIIANVYDTFTREHVIAEVDECRFARIAEKAYTSLGNRVSETINTTKGDAHEITHSWNTAFAWLKEHGVPEDEQVIFISPDVNTAVLNTPEIYKTLNQIDYKSASGVTFQLQAYMGRPIVVVPSDRFYDKVVTNENGFAPASGAKLLNYIVCSKKAVNPFVKLSKMKIFTPDMVQDYDGYKINFRVYHDCIIPKEKAIANYVSVSTVDASTKASALNIAMREGSVSKSYVVDDYYTTPGGIFGTLVISQTAFTLGASVTVDGSTIKAVSVSSDGVEVNNDAGTATKGYFALVNGGKVVAASAQLTLTLKA